MTNLAERAQRIAASARVSHETERERNRREMPLATKFVDEWRPMLAGGVLTEGDRRVEFGKRTPDARVNTLQFVSCKALGEWQKKHPGRKW